MNKTQKIELIKELTEELKSASLVLLVDYTGLSVKKQQELKKKLKEVNSEMLIVKNTLFKIAGREADINEEVLSDKVLSGPMALILAEEDPVSSLQVISKFSKENEILNMKVAIVEGNFQGKEALEILSQLPPKEILFAQAVGAISSPIYGLVGTLQGNLQKLVYILQSKAGIS